MINDPKPLIFLAPMTGVTDLPFRKMVRKFGGGTVFSEMIASRCMVDEMRGSQKARASYVDEPGLAVQIAGCEPDIIAEAAKMNEARGASLIDLNFGCPVKKIVNKMGGSALMRDEALAARIMEATVKAVKIPITVKMRLGWDAQSINAPRLAKMAEDIGIRRITVHGRTRNQLYNGNADWQMVRRVREATTLPLIVNGDIVSFETARTALERSGADGVMIGRGSFGKPWVLREIANAFDGKTFTPPSPQEMADIIDEHYQELLSCHGTHQGVLIGRKHIGWYVDGMAGAHEFKARVNRMDDPVHVRKEIRDYLSNKSSQY